MRTAPALREFLGPRPRQLPEPCITRSSAHESEAADQQAPITIKAVRCAGDAIDEIQAALDRCLSADVVSCFGHSVLLKLLTPQAKNYIECPQFKTDPTLVFSDVGPSTISTEMRTQNG